MYLDPATNEPLTAVDPAENDGDLMNPRTKQLFRSQDLTHVEEPLPAPIVPEAAPAPPPE